MQPTQLTIILPCYNPERGWQEMVIQKMHELQKHLQAETLALILVNDGSARGIEDAQVEQLRKHFQHFQYISYAQNRGKGFALRAGVAAAQSNYYIYTDIDFPYTINSLVAVYRRLKDGNDVVVGVREQAYYQKVPAKRVFISKVLKRMIGTFLRMPITDTQCGLKGFNNKGKQVFCATTINRFLFDMEFVALSFRKGNLKVVPEVVHTRPGVVFSHMNYKVLLGESWSFFKLILPFGSK